MNTEILKHVSELQDDRTPSLMQQLERFMQTV